METSSSILKNDDEEIDKSDSKSVYFLRKRPRLSRGDKNSPVSEKRCVYTRIYRRKTPVMFMPTEVLQNILSYFTNNELAKSIRLINRRFKIVAELLLNSRFTQLKLRLYKIKRMIDASMQHTEDDMEIRCLCKMLGVLEVLTFYYTLLTSTIWRYISFKNQPSNICMYAGSILDKYNTAIFEFIKEPHKIYAPLILKDYTLPNIVKDICAESKEFVIHFDRVTESQLKDDDFCIPCKALDILDSATDVKRTVISQRSIGNTLSLNVKYYFSNSWFVALDINDEKPKSWKEQQRLMFMRLRRIVLGHSEMSMEYNQFKRETTFRVNAKPKIRRPINSVYTGYGEVGEKFFYYGVMNEGAYINKFVSPDASYSFDSVDDKLKTRYLGLYISVELRCPKELAPYAILNQYTQMNELLIEEKRYVNSTPRRRRRKIRDLLELKMEFLCPSAIFPRLPTFYRYYVNNSK
ncbi:uncharacterized protein [Onthophagus taurus]|uniref:uncharacterized protein n=1 Tax=Onthophagus taurus TaxID=166361 RepID=UPI000C2015E9|nr:uncharacterized protein LOC111426102 [Onthophagus taurus]